MSWSDTLQTVLKQVSPQLIALLLDVIESIQSYVKQKSPAGLYEILEYETQLELLDPKGRTVLLTKRERVRFLQDYAIAFQDYAWGEGNVLAEYKCSPGFEADRYLEGDRWNILISLRDTKHRGDMQDFYIERKLTKLYAAAGWSAIAALGEY